ncbi:hypothetical protein HYC85_012219 [Camellia sinensis]|uniref:Uncharacterized protein n=1 Tax=Camellia sinensis TaxID=4442 RepID=A0A7J7HEK2_CAMSI|nr:hypothetical protein HYC85_012219 [Camellia sinensis]
MAASNIGYVTSDQVDVTGNIFGLLASHPNTPLVSLHHLDLTAPIFPNMTTTKALEHLLEASKFAMTDGFRGLSRCHGAMLFKFSATTCSCLMFFVLNGHLVQWKRGNALSESYTFDTSDHHPDPCRRPTVFFFDKTDSGDGDGINSSYIRMIHENCTFDIVSPKKLEEVRVFSRKMELDIKQLRAPRRHCCDVLPSSSGKVMEIAIRECKEEELIYMHS